MNIHEVVLSEQSQIKHVIDGSSKPSIYILPSLSVLPMGQCFIFENNSRGPLIIYDHAMQVLFAGSSNHKKVAAIVIPGPNEGLEWMVESYKEEKR